MKTIGSVAIDKKKTAHTVVNPFVGGDVVWIGTTNVPCGFTIQILNFVSYCPTHIIYIHGRAGRSF